jgi:hypothetical protein
MAEKDHDLLIRIDERVLDILKEIKSINGRLRAVEKWKWRISGGLTLLALVVGVVGGKLFLF